MKKVILVIAALVICLTVNAKIWRVNNNTGISADFTTIQAAHDGASAGDTLHIESSPTSYGDLTASKPLTILGPGYFLGQNPSPTQQDTLGASTGGINFISGSDGSMISGLSIHGYTIILAGHITIIRNYIFFYDIRLDGAYDFDYTSIIQNYMDGGIIIDINNNSSILHSNITIANNYVATGSAESNIHFDDNFHLNIINNVINPVFNSPSSINVSNSIIQNNIVNGSIIINSGNTITYNIDAANDVLPATNQTNVPFAPLFVGTGSTDGQWQLASNSQALGAGIGQSDCGMFGTTGPNNPYVLSGIPAIPSIYQLFGQHTISTNTPTITISVKSNQ